MRVIRGGFEPDGTGAAGPLGVSGVGGRPLVGALDLGPRPGEVGGNLLLAGRALARAKRRHPSLRWAVLPELFTCAYSGLPSAVRHAEDARDGQSARFFAALARGLGLHIAYGFPELLPGGGVADAANLVGPGGLLLTYRKRHLVRAAGEHRVFSAGRQTPTVEAGGARVALAICWDLGFPETVRGAALAGAELILAPAGWREPWGAQYALSCAARALDSGVYVASANQRGDYPQARFGAPGGVWGPDGARLSGEAGAVSVAGIDPGLPGRWRSLYGSTIQGGAEAAPLEACCY